MCGLVGMILKATFGASSSEANAFEELLYIDALRGDDSTGLASFHNDGTVHLLKEATPADYFRSSKEFREWWSDFIKNGKAVIGHNRKKTSGKIQDDTAHPFLVKERYCFTHNGTLYSHKHLADTEVDSEALGIHLTQAEGDPRKLEELLEVVGGAYACVWLDQEKEKVYFLRNAERPLWYALTSAGIVYASEPAFLYAALSRNRIKIDEVKEVEKHTLMEVDINTLKITEEVLQVKKHIPSTKQKTHSSGTKEPQTVSGTDTANPYRGDGKEVSKNGYKRFQQSSKLQNKYVTFWVDDIVECYPNDTTKNEWWIFGTNVDQIEQRHLFKGRIQNVNIKQLEDSYESKLLTAKVDRIEYDRVSKQLIIYVSGILPIPTSFSKEVKQPYETSSIIH